MKNRRTKKIKAKKRAPRSGRKSSHRQMADISQKLSDLSTFLAREARSNQSLLTNERWRVEEIKNQIAFDMNCLVLSVKALKEWQSMSWWARIKRTFDYRQGTA